jgi:hypothetical protein
MTCYFLLWVKNHCDYFPQIFCAKIPKPAVTMVVSNPSYIDSKQKKYKHRSGFHVTRCDSFSMVDLCKNEFFCLCSILVSQFVWTWLYSVSVPAAKKVWRDAFHWRPQTTKQAYHSNMTDKLCRSNADGRTAWNILSVTYDPIWRCLIYFQLHVPHSRVLMTEVSFQVGCGHGSFWGDAVYKYVVLVPY